MFHRKSQEARLLLQPTLKPGLLDGVQVTSHYLYDAPRVQMSSVRALTRPTSSLLQQLRAVDFVRMLGKSDLYTSGPDKYQMAYGHVIYLRQPQLTMQTYYWA